MEPQARLQRFLLLLAAAFIAIYLHMIIAPLYVVPAVAAAYGAVDLMATSTAINTVHGLLMCIAGAALIMLGSMYAGSITDRLK